MKIVQASREISKDWQYFQVKKNLKHPLVLVFGNRYFLVNRRIC